MRIHLLGPSGSGTTSLGKALSEKLNIPWFDTDDIFWIKTDPPFTNKQDREKRINLLKEIDVKNKSWIISGSMLDWGDFLRDKMDLIIYLYVDKNIRINRLIKRETKRFGKRIENGSDMYEQHNAFLTWASSYEEGGLDMRSKKSELAWLKKAECTIIKIEKEIPIEEEVEVVLNSIEKRPNKSIEKEI